MRKKRILSIMLSIFLVLVMFGSPLISTNALDDETINDEEEFIDDEDADEIVIHQHVYSDWTTVKEPTYDEDGLEERYCSDCNEREERVIPKLVPIEIEDVQVEVDTNLEDSNDTTSVQQQTELYINVGITGFSGVVTITDYDKDGNVYSRKSFNRSSFMTIKIPRGEQSRIVCEISGEDLENTKQSFYEASGTFSGGPYYLNVNVKHVDPCTHTRTRTVVVNEATYTNDGLSKIVCSDCGALVSTETIPKLVCSHTNTTETVINEATEYSTGTVKITCADCGQYIRTDVLPKKTHVHNYTQRTVDATCAAEGYVLNICTTCGNSEIDHYIPKIDHTWDNGTITVQPSCGVEGVKTYTCTECGATKTEVISALTHDYQLSRTVNATCKEAGYTEYVCSHCNDVKRTTIPKTNQHDYSGEYVVTKAATCKTTGLSELRCTVCGEVIDTITLPKTSHQYSWVVSQEATATTDGLKEHKCSVCGNVNDSEVIPKTGTVACTHPYPRDFVETVPATCSSYPRGNVVCKQCGEVIAYDYESSSRGYNPDNHTHFTETITVEPTYKTTGVKRYTCDDCGYYYTESIPKLDCPHAHTNIKDLADGSWKVCKDCGEKIEQVSSIPSTCSHVGTKKTQVLIKAPTSTEWGEAAMVCECGKTVSTEQLHPYSEYQVTKPDGSVITVYGWFDYDWAHEIAEQTNAYRIENGLNALHYNESLQYGSDQRALETIASFSHTRPNGERWNTLLPQWQYGGENLASGQTTVASAMNAWKNSATHNANLLYGIQSGNKPFKGISVGVFHRYIFNSSSKPYTPSEYIYWTQHFTFTEY